MPRKSADTLDAFAHGRQASVVVDLFVERRWLTSTLPDSTGHRSSLGRDVARSQRQDKFALHPILWIITVSRSLELADPAS